MPKKRANKDGDNGEIPQVAPETWKRLLAAAEDLNRLAPWDWMEDRQIVALRYPRTGELLYCSILGALRTMFALLIYRNAAGHRWILNTVFGDVEPWEDTDAAYSQDALKVEFVLKRELEKADREAFARANFSPSVKGSRVWPQCRSFVPGGLPWHVTESEAEAMVFAIPRVAAAAELVREMPGLWDNHESEIAFVPDSFDPAKERLQAEQLDFRPILAPPEAAPEPVMLEEGTVARLLKLKQRKGFDLELDLAYSGAIIVAGAGRARFGRVAMAVDGNSGLVAGHHISDEETADGKALATVIEEALIRLGARPETIRVQRERVALMIRKVGEQLGTEVLIESELPNLNEATAAMEQFMQARAR